MWTTKHLMQGSWTELALCIWMKNPGTNLVESIIYNILTYLSSLRRSIVMYFKYSLLLAGSIRLHHLQSWLNHLTEWSIWPNNYAKFQNSIWMGGGGQNQPFSCFLSVTPQRTAGFSPLIFSLFNLHSTIWHF